MSPLLVILGMALVTFVPRYLGLRLSGRAVPPFWLRFFQFVPVAVFPALIVPELIAVPEETGIRLLAFVVAGLVLLRWRALWTGLLAGMVAFWLLRLLLQASGQSS